MKHSLLSSMVIVCLLASVNIFGQQPAAPDHSDAGSLAVSRAAQPNAIIPRLIKFNGVLHDLSGKPIAGPVDVTFALYAGEAGGNALWFETQTVRADALGNYTVLLGAMTPAGVPMELFTSGEAHWLGVQVSNLPEQSRVLLVSVPYAMKAGDAETLGGKPASDYLLSSQAAAGAATTGATAGALSGLITSGSTQTSTAATQPIPQALTATQNYIPVMTDDLGSLGNSLIYQNGANLGIGTTSPSSTLNVKGRITADGAVTNSGAPPGFVASPANHITASGTHFTRGAILTPTMPINGGITDAGGLNGVYAIALRNYNSTGDSGTMATLYSMFFQYGHSNSDAGATPITTNAYGVYISPYFRTGTVTNAYDLYLAPDSTGGTVTNEWGIYQSSTTKKNYFGGNVGIGVSNPAQKLSVAGIIQSTTGGFKFPDGSIQTKAATGGGGGATDFSQLSGTVGPTQLSGPYTNALTFSNSSNSFTGNGAGLTGISPTSVTGTAATLGANSFTGDQNISGNLILGGTLNGMAITASKTTSCTLLSPSSTCQSANVLGGYTGSGGGGSFLPSRVSGGGTTNSVVSGGNSIAEGVVGGTISGGGGTITTQDQTVYDYGNKVTNNWGTVGGGAENQAGDSNGASSENCCETVSGGRGNIASGGYAAVGGGVINTASESYTTVSGGSWNVASALFASVGGGYNNTATAYGATVAGGVSNNATGTYSFAAGCLSSAASHGAFVWGGGNGAACVSVASSGDGQFVANAPGGFWLGNATSTPTVSIPHFLDTSTGAYLTTSGVWTDNSDRNLKTAFEPLEQPSLLARIGQLPITSWQYKVDPDSVRHIGPMAQDFYAAFKLGNDDKHISTIDEGGVALAGVQALYRLSLTKDEEIRKQQERIRALEQQAEDLKSQNRALAQKVEELSKQQREIAALKAAIEKLIAKTSDTIDLASR